MLPDAKGPMDTVNTPWRESGSDVPKQSGDRIVWQQVRVNADTLISRPDVGPGVVTRINKGDVIPPHLVDFERTPVPPARNSKKERGS
jgi:hypothetical protein